MYRVDRNYDIRWLAHFSSTVHVCATTNPLLVQSTMCNVRWWSSFRVFCVDVLFGIEKVRLDESRSCTFWVLFCVALFTNRRIYCDDNGNSDGGDGSNRSGTSAQNPYDHICFHNFDSISAGAKRHRVLVDYYYIAIIMRKEDSWTGQKWKKSTEIYLSSSRLFVIDVHFYRLIETIHPKLYT